MNVNVIGGGPGGLYASLLLKKSNPDWDITLYERDPADNTYGWGIVFSDSTLSALREADYRTHQQITDRFIEWDPIDVHYDGEYIRCGGHRFAGMMRADLKDILRDRCDEVGVEMHFETDVDDPNALAAESELLVGADGARSITRETFSERFKPRITEGNAKFAWFGTAKPFDVFTFIFRENEDGLWRIHAYPGRKSTFIVECTEETWRNAGLDEKSEDDGLAYLEDLFADHLNGYDLESKLYGWRNFPIVKNRTWHHDDENVVLLGDAAHTAHFSIGSGTKMAMEDAIALYEGFEEHPEDEKAAIRWYEKERRPAVEALQKASRHSRRYFETVERYTNLEPQQFVFNMLTRSGRITYDELGIRDREYVDEFDRWYARRTNGTEAERAVATPPMHQPLSLRDVTVPNRAAFSPTPSSDATDGVPSERQLRRLSDLGSEGVGLVMTEPVSVSSIGRITPGTPGLYGEEHGDAWASAVEQTRKASDRTTLGIELVHAGQRGATKPRAYGLDRPLPDDDAWDLLSASATPYTSSSQIPKAMDADDMKRVRERFAYAVQLADQAGFDLLQLHFGHGYLLSSFLSPRTNERDDEYGGSLENRLRYPLDVFDAVRAVWPDEKPVSVKLPATDWAPDGYDLTDAFAAGARLEEHGCDLLTVVAGQTTANDRPKFDPDVLGNYCEQIRNEVNVPAMSTNYLTTSDDVNTQVGGATADLCQWYPEHVDVNSL
ncbi:oxidoreductase [Natronococcus wangiae]|uniref:oxidoreductase n=1 Tax=Natronococcus wangiae TaxID=3068275 RepID=UPI00273F9864|nr:FAD-dependent monooxygenase [Natronococcus sp. AD5]